MKSLFTFCIVLLSASGLFNKSYNLSLNLEKGKTYYQSSSAEIHIKQEINGQSMDITTGVDGKMSYKVVGLEKDLYNLESAYEMLGMSVKTPYTSMDFSSEKNDDSDMLSKILANMKAKPFNVALNKNGRVHHVEGVDKLLEGLLSDVPDLPEDQKTQIMAQLEQTYGNEAFRGNIEMVTAIFPDKKVSLNDQWSNQIELHSSMNGTIENTFTLSELTDDYAIIKGTAVIKTLEQQDYKPINGVPAKINLTGNSTSTIKVDRHSGWIISADIQQHFQGNIDIQDSEKVPGGMTVPMEMTSDIKISG